MTAPSLASWGENAPLSAAAEPLSLPPDGGLDEDLMREVHARAAAAAAAAVGLSPSAAMSVLPHLQNGAGGAPAPQPPFNDSGMFGPEATVIPCAGSDVGQLQQPEELFTCTVCRKAFKREMNLIFHMTTHRPRQPEVDTTDSASAAPVKCQDCGKEFATKYQAKKHFLRRHFQGEKPFACTKCNKKRFVVKEDLTMHMKSCGNVYICKCGIRLCSLGALKRHCKYFSHEALSYDPQPDPVVAAAPTPATLGWNGLEGVSSISADTPGNATEVGRLSIDGAGGAAALQGLQGLQGIHPPNAAGALGSSLSAARGGLLPGGLAQNGLAGRGGLGSALGIGIGGLGTPQHEAALNAALNSYQPMARGAGGAGGAGGVGGAGAGASAPLARPHTFLPAPYPISSAAEDAVGGNNWPQAMLNGMVPSLAQALRRMPDFAGGQGAAQQPGSVPLTSAAGQFQPGGGGVPAGNVAGAALTAAVAAAFQGQYAGQGQGRPLEGEATDGDAKRPRIA